MRPNELRERLRHPTRDPGPLGSAVCALLNAAEAEVPVMVMPDEARAILALLAPQEAPEVDAAKWAQEYDRLRTEYKGAVIEYYGQPSGAGFDAVEAAEKMRAARRALDAHVLAAARPAPETREPDGWVVDAPESLPSHVAQRVVYWGPDAKRRANNRVQRMAEVFRAFAVANPVYLGAAAPAEATERSES